MEYVIEMLNITKEFPGIKANDNITLQLKKGEIHALLGENGAGKSTLLKMISHLVIPNKGNIYVKGYSINEQYEKALGKMGINFFEGMLINSLSAYQNICLRVNALGLGKNRKMIVQKVIDEFDMADYANKKCEDYSLGMKQRTALALACVGSPDLLLLDEPMNGLDPLGIKSTRAWIKRMSKDGVATIVSSHLLYDIERLSDRLLIMSRGKLLADMKVVDILKKYESIEDFYFETTEGTL